MDEDKKNYYVRDDDPDWKDTSTVDEWAIRMMRTNQTKTEAFRAALELWGRERFEKLWHEMLAGRGRDQK